MAITNLVWQSGGATIAIDNGTPVTVTEQSYSVDLTPGQHLVKVEFDNGAVVEQTIDVPDVVATSEVESQITSTLASSQGYVDVQEVYETGNAVIPYGVKLKVKQNGNGDGKEAVVLKVWDNAGNALVDEALTFTDGYSQLLDISKQDMLYGVVYDVSGNEIDRFDLAFTDTVIDEDPTLTIVVQDAVWVNSNKTVSWYKNDNGSSILGFALFSKEDYPTSPTATLLQGAELFDVEVTSNSDDTQWSVQVRFKSGIDYSTVYSDHVYPYTIRIDKDTSGTLSKFISIVSGYVVTIPYIFTDYVQYYSIMPKGSFVTFNQSITGTLSAYIWKVNSDGSKTIVANEQSRSGNAILFEAFDMSLLSKYELEVRVNGSEWSGGASLLFDPDLYINSTYRAAGSAQTIKLYRENDLADQTVRMYKCGNGNASLAATPNVETTWSAGDNNLNYGLSEPGQYAVFVDSIYVGMIDAN